MAVGYEGDHEIIYNGKIQWAIPSGNTIKYGNVGSYRCNVCGTVTNAVSKYIKRKKPEICPNNDCKRKKTMELEGPEHLQKPIWLLPGKPIKCKKIDIFNELSTFFRDSIVLQEHEYDILCLWTIASWLVDDFRTCPYIALIAPTSSGKTQVMETIRQTSYRAFATASVTPAALFRSIELWNITLCIDEAQDLINSKTEIGQAIYSCLLSGYKRGMPALRSGDGSNNFIPESFNVFGFKAFSGTKLVLPTLESRSIAFEMRKSKPKNIMVDEDAATRIRSMLLYYRFHNLGKTNIIIPDCESGRLVELFTPLMTVAFGLKCGESLDFMLNKMTTRDAEEDIYSMEGQIVQAIYELSTENVVGGFGTRTMVFAHEVVEYVGLKQEHGSSITIGKKLKLLQIPKKHTRMGTGVDLTNPETIRVLDQLYTRYKIKNEEVST